MTTGDEEPQSAAAYWPEEMEASGNPDVDAIMAALAEVPGLPTQQHAAAYEQLHDRLLAELDAESD